LSRSESASQRLSGEARDTKFDIVNGPDSETVTSIEARLDAVDTALTRLRDGSYRSCQVCGAPIDDGLLNADPTRTTCVAHPQLS